MSTLELDYELIGRNGTAKVTAKLGGAVIACEKLDLLKPEKRDGFASRLCEHHGNIDRAQLNVELLRLADEVTSKPESKPCAELPELESAAIVRPELFHRSDVSGLSVPIVSSIGSEARARWYLYLQWADGRRERRELSGAIELPGAGRLIVHPIPSDPSPTTATAWSLNARRAWLDGSGTPDPADLFRRICERIEHYLDFAPESATGTTRALALWSMFTYIYPAWPAVPYLAVGGPMGSGKSTLFSVLGQLVFRPMQSSSMTGQCLFRTLNEQGGTLLLDEAERLRDSAPEVGELRSILLSGYKRGSPARRLEKVGDGFQQLSYDVFGPKALACIGALPEALASRCIRLTMFRAGADSPKPRRRIDADPEWQGLRDDLHALALAYGPIWIQLAANADVVPAALAGREYELWQPILALAEWLDGCGVRGLLPLMQRHALDVADDARDDSTPPADELLLRLLAAHVLVGSAATLTPARLLHEARERDDATFKGWSAPGIARALGRYGAKTHRADERTYSHVTVAQLRRIESAYGLRLGIPGQAPSEPTEPTVPTVLGGLGPADVELDDTDRRVLDGELGA
jgi:hypothetical protein